MRYLVSILLLLFSSGCLAQHFWVRPDEYFYDPNKTAKVEIVSGDEFKAKPFSLEKDNLHELSVIFNGNATDIRRNFVGGESPMFTAQLFSDGLYHTIVKVRNQEINLTDSAYHVFVKQHGIESIDSGSKTGDSLRPMFDNTVKCYLRVGSRYKHSVEKPVGDPIEVVPDRNPLLLRKGDPITFHVFKFGKPAFGVRVKVSNRWNNRTTVQHIYTQKDGTASTHVSSPGEWMVTVAHIDDSENKLYCYNLIFGYR